MTKAKTSKTPMGTLRLAQRDDQAWIEIVEGSTGLFFIGPISRKFEMGWAARIVACVNACQGMDAGGLAALTDKGGVMALLERGERLKAHHADQHPGCVARGGGN